MADREWYEVEWWEARSFFHPRDRRRKTEQFNSAAEAAHKISSIRLYPDHHELVEVRRTNVRPLAQVKYRRIGPHDNDWMVVDPDEVLKHLEPGVAYDHAQMRDHSIPLHADKIARALEET